MPPPPSTLSPIPTPIPVDAYSYRVSASKSPEERIPDPDRLAPEDAYFATSLTRARTAPVSYVDNLSSLSSDGTAVTTLQHPRGPLAADPGRKDMRKLGGAGSRRRRKGAWKKLLWVKQSCTDMTRL